MALLCTWSIRLLTSKYFLFRFNPSYVITDELLEQAYQRAQKDGKQVKMMLFTNPNNPTGTVYSEEEMRIVLTFCRRHNIHLVFPLNSFYPVIV